jgi:predicted transcriptional regulator
MNNRIRVLKQFGKLLIGIRQEEKLTQKQLSLLTQVPRSVIARIECKKGKKLPRLDCFAKMLSKINYKTYIMVVKNKEYIKIRIQ